jgi:hypothetical protein
MLVSVVCEVESEKNLRRQPPWQQPIYSDDIHRSGRYIAGAQNPERWTFPHGRDREIPRWRDIARRSRLFGRDAPQVDHQLSLPEVPMTVHLHELIQVPD